jgi:hypothetical protein
MDAGSESEPFGVDADPGGDGGAVASRTAEAAEAVGVGAGVAAAGFGLEDDPAHAVGRRPSKRRP